MKKNTYINVTVRFRDNEGQLKTFGARIPGYLYGHLVKGAEEHSANGKKMPLSKYMIYVIDNDMSRRYNRNNLELPHKVLCALRLDLRNWWNALPKENKGTTKNPDFSKYFRWILHNYFIGGKNE